MFQISIAPYVKNTLLVSCVMLFTLSAAAQQKDLKAQQILQGVSSRYKELKTIQADFTVDVESTGKTATEQYGGTIYLKGNKYKLKLSDQEIISDHINIWTYLKKANEVQIQEYDADDNSISPADLFTLYEKDFLYAYLEEKNINGKTLQVIELTPNDKTRPYFKVRLSVDKVARVIHSAVVFDKNGNRYTYTVTRFLPNPEIAESFFTFDPAKYPGIEVIDLR